MSKTQDMPHLVREHAGELARGVVDLDDQGHLPEGVGGATEAGIIGADAVLDAVENALAELVAEIGDVAERIIIADELLDIRETIFALSEREDINLILTTGGTGLGPRDNTPEATRGVIDREAPGIAEAMRREPFVPPDLWNEALNANALALTVATPELVIAMMKLAHATRTAPSDAAEEARVDSEETDREARQVEGERRVREAAARGEKLSLSKAMAQIRREQGSEED